MANPRYISVGDDPSNLDQDGVNGFIKGYMGADGNRGVAKTEEIVIESMNSWKVYAETGKVKIGKRNG